MSSLREAWKDVIQKEEGTPKPEMEENKSINFAG